MAERPGLAILALSFDDGGVERSLVQLALGLVRLGIGVDLLAGNRASPYLPELDGPARVLHPPATAFLRVLPWLLHYLREERPRVLLSAKEPASRAALWAAVLLWRRFSRRAGVRVVFQAVTPVSVQLGERNPLSRVLLGWVTRRLYRAADQVIAVSPGVARDLEAFAGLPADSVAVVPNPIVSPALAALASAPPDHPWLREKDRPVILAVGRLARTKDFPTLLRAFDLLRQRRPARLVILGEGRQRQRLERMIASLGIGADVVLHGFRANPYADMAAADVLALSSRREGFGNVLIEAMALGTPAVATDCPYGPREALDGGRYGTLVPVGDHTALAQALEHVLDASPDAALLREGAARYEVGASVRIFARAVGLPLPGHPAAAPGT